MITTHILMITTHIPMITTHILTQQSSLKAIGLKRSPRIS